MTIVDSRSSRLALGFAAALPLSVQDGAANETGLLFASTEKSNELTLVDPPETNCRSWVRRGAAARCRGSAPMFQGP